LTKISGQVGCDTGNNCLDFGGGLNHNLDTGIV